MTDKATPRKHNMLDETQINFMRLLMRSPDRGGGWRSVSETLRPVVIETVSKQPELYETKDESGQLMLRLSDRGAILAEYF